MKSIQVNEATHGFILDHKNSKNKSADAVIWAIIDENGSLKIEIEKLKYEIKMLKNKRYEHEST